MSDIIILDGGVSILLGDVRARLAAMEPDSVDCVVTSPPYWGLRDYGVDGQIGLERTLGEHLEVMLDVFRLVRRVLKPTGTLWLNYGDCYATTPNGRSAADCKAAGGDDRTFRDKPFSTIGPIYAASHEAGDRRGAECKQHTHDVGDAPHRGRIVAGGALKPKDLCMVPNRLAIALQEDGWWVRSEIIWAKPNPMPESIRDRPATSHEKVFLLTKGQRYFYDAEAVKQAVSPNTNPRVSQNLAAQEGSHRAAGGGKTSGPMRVVVAGSARKLAAEGQNMIGQKASREAALSLRVESRNLRNYEPAPLGVWPVSSRGFADAHFATFPPELAERCILAGCPKGGLVLDPFGGAGTTGLVAARHGRRSVLIELNPEYAEIARRRIEREWKVPQAAPSQDFGPLFAAGEVVG